MALRTGICKVNAAPPLSGRTGSVVQTQAGDVVASDNWLLDLSPRSFNLWARWLNYKSGCDMEHSVSRLIIAAGVACLVMGMAAIQQMRLNRPIGKVKYFLLKLAVLVWLVSGLFVGTLYSHGVDVAWYIFGVAVSLAGCVVAGIVVFAWPFFTGRKPDS